MYYSNHIITMTAPRSAGNPETGEIYTTWICFLRGEEVGEITYSSILGRRQDKHYEACVYLHTDDRYHRTKEVGYFDTLAAAKAALLLPACEYLEGEEEHKRQKQAPIAYLPEADSEFYPTPSSMAGALIASINWTGIENILEPSAGKGDLIEYALRRNEEIRYSSSIKDRVDCVEIDPNLRAILKYKGFRVIHDDFLTFNTRKRYSLILMNPPFSEGDKHLFHALELCEHGGQIACVLNAETIRNPYTNIRRLLVKRLQKLNASIRIINDAFKHAERSARVDVALINVNIPASFRDSSIWDDLQRARDIDMDGEQFRLRFDVAPANHVERLIREYDMLCEAGITLMAKYNGVAPYIMNGTGEYSRPLLELSVGQHSCDRRCGASDVNRFLRLARSRYWHELLSLPELRNRMTTDMRSKYEETINQMADYEFSLFNVQEVIQQITGQLTEGVEAAILKCFVKLSNEHTYHDDIQNDNIHYYNGWKTNKAHRVNEKCIIPAWGCFAKGYRTDKYGRWKDVLEGLDPHSCVSLLDDLEKALDYLDRGETGPTDLASQLQIAANMGRTRDIQCKYFSVTFYKKGTCHIRFTNQMVLDRLNIYVGRQKAWLPPTYGKVRYEEMTEEDQRTVDEFQGREKYGEVVRFPDRYIIEAENVPLLVG